MVQTGLFETETHKVPYANALLKSSMQKRIRRGETAQALRLAKSLMHKDAHDFARRVMVVVPEESWVHPLMSRMPYIITKLQRKGAVADDEDKSIMLTLVRDASDAKTRDFYIKNPDDKPFEPSQLEYLNDAERELVNALRFRQTIGGMRADIGMFASLVNIWVNRFSNRLFNYSEFNNIFDLEQPMVKWDDVDYANDDDFPYYAMDFHCAPFISNLLLDRKKSNTPEDFEHNAIKQAIDKYVDRAAYNHRSDGRAGDDFYTGVIYKIMWMFESSHNTKPNHWFDPPRTVDWFTDKHVTDEHLPIKEQLALVNEELKPRWKKIAEWYVRKQREG